MRKKAFALTFILTVLISAIPGAFIVKLAQANPYMYHEFVSPPAGSTPLVISVAAPKNIAIYNVNDIALTFNISTQGTSMNYLLGAYYKADWMSDNVTVYKQNTYSPEFPEFWEYSETLRNIPDGGHSIVITAWGGGFYAEGLTAYNFDMTTISVINFTIDATPPKVSILSPENKTYDLSDVPLDFNVSESSSIIRYSIDGQDNSTLNGNTTLTGLPIGRHSLTVYAWDSAGNLGVSETVVFNVAKPEPELLPTATVALASAGVAMVVAAGLLVYFKKRKRGLAAV
jgi:hypothetical protein